MQLAGHLHLPLQETKNSTTASEFVQWMYWLDKEEDRKRKEVTKQDFYLAQIAAEVCRTVVKDRKSVKNADFLLKFEDESKPKKLTKEEATIRAKTRWMSWNPPKKPLVVVQKPFLKRKKK